MVKVLPRSKKLGNFILLKNSLGFVISSHSQNEEVKRDHKVAERKEAGAQRSGSVK